MTEEQQSIECFGGPLDGSYITLRHTARSFRVPAKALQYIVGVRHTSVEIPEADLDQPHYLYQRRGAAWLFVDRFPREDEL